MKKLLTVLISILMVMALLLGCTQEEMREDQKPMEDQAPLNNNTPESGNPLNEGPENQNLDQNNPTNDVPANDNQGNLGLNGLKFAMNQDDYESYKEAFKLLEDALIETNNYGKFEAV